MDSITPQSLDVILALIKSGIASAEHDTNRSKPSSESSSSHSQPSRESSSSRSQPSRESSSSHPESSKRPSSSHSKPSRESSSSRSQPSRESSSSHPESSKRPSSSHPESSKRPSSSRPTESSSKNSSSSAIKKYKYSSGSGYCPRKPIQMTIENSIGLLKNARFRGVHSLSLYYLWINNGMENLSDPRLRVFLPPIQIPVKQGNLAMIKQYDPNRIFPSNLTMAIAYGRLDIVKYMTEYVKADQTHFMDAIVYGDLPIVRLLSNMIKITNMRKCIDLAKNDGVRLFLETIL